MFGLFLTCSQSVRAKKQIGRTLILSNCLTTDLLESFTGLVLGGGGGGRPDYLQKLKVPEGYEKMIDYSNI